jgi:hypothetical protein
MKAPTHFAALSELTSRDFRKQSVITPKSRFDFYDDGQNCNVINWSSEHQVHVYHCLNYSNVDGKPLYFVETYSMLGVGCAMSRIEPSKRSKRPGVADFNDLSFYCRKGDVLCLNFVSKSLRYVASRLDVISLLLMRHLVY